MSRTEKDSTKQKGSVGILKEFLGDLIYVTISNFVVVLPFNTGLIQYLKGKSLSDHQIVLDIT